MTALAAALDYAARGWGVIPIEAAGKRPHFAALERIHGGTAWKPLAARAASEPEIRGWYEHDPDAGVGIILGQPSNGIVVADVDRPGQTCGMRHPPTAIVKAHRGPHIYFQASGVLATINTPYGELRGDGGYVVAPPSRHASGAEYCWLVHPDDCELAAVDYVLDVQRLATGTQSVLLTVYPDGVTPLPGSGKHFAKLDAAVEVAVRTWGVTVPLGRAFSCVLPGHGPDLRRSASLFRGSDDIWRYRDWHAGKHDGPPWLTLAEVRASRGANRTVQLTAPSQSCFYRLLFHEAGLLPASPVPISVPDGCSATARKLAEGFGLLLGLRGLTDNGPAPYTRAFAAAWCSIGERRAGEGIAELRKAGVLAKVAQFGRTNLYLSVCPSERNHGKSVQPRHVRGSRGADS